MRELGFVEKVQSDEIFVLARRDSACGSDCNSCSAKCESKVEVFKFKNTIGAKQGDLLWICSKGKSVNSYLFLVYGLPLLALMLGIVITNIMISDHKNVDIISFIVGILLMCMSFLIIKFVDNKFKKSSQALMFIEKYDGEK